MKYIYTSEFYIEINPSPAYETCLSEQAPPCKKSKPLLAQTECLCSGIITDSY